MTLTSAESIHISGFGTKNVLRSLDSPELEWPSDGTLDRASWSTRSMSDNESSDDSSDGVECPVDGCEFEGVSNAGVNRHVGLSHGDLKKDVYLNEIKRLFDDLGHVPTIEDLNSSGAYSMEVYKSNFGSWNDALDEAGFSANQQRDIPDDDLLDELIRLASEIGRPPRARDMESYGEYSVYTYQKRFGCWNDALENAGLETSVFKGITDEEALDELHRLSEELERAPRVEDMNRDGKFSEIVYHDRFGSWNNALDEAGFSANQRRDIPDDDLLDELERIAEKYGSPPTHSTVDQYGMFSVSTYERRFGSWTDAVREAGFEPLAHADWVLSGKDHPFWNGGDINYGPGWTESKKEQVRERDNRECQNCGLSESEHIERFGRKHHVHHIQKARSFVDPEKRNHPDNLVTLCMAKKCHQLWEKMSPLRPQLAGDT